MKIIFTLTYYFPYVSGLTIHVQRLAEEFVSLGHKVEVLTSQYQKRFPRFEVRDKVSIYRVPYLFKLSKGFFMPMYIFYAFLSIKKNDVVVVNLPQFEGFIVSIMARIMGKRLYCIYHCEVSLPRSPTNLLIENFLHVSNFISLLCSHKIVAYTKDFTRHSKLLPFFCHKVTIIYPPILVPKISIKRLNSLRNKLTKRKKYTVGLAARIASEKGIEYLLEAIPLIKEKVGDNFVIIIAGPKDAVGEEEYWRKIHPLLELYKECVQFVGTFSSKDIGLFYSLLDVLVLPSVNSTEAFGMVQVEAMLCGVPVVASNLPGVRVPIVTTGMGELAEPKNSQDIAEKIVKILKDKKRYIKKREFIESKFSFRNIINQYEKVFTVIA